MHALANVAFNIWKRLPPCAIDNIIALAGCNHEYIRMIPDGPRDNGEYEVVCRWCGDAWGHTTNRHFAEHAGEVVVHHLRRLRLQDGAASRCQVRQCLT